jgi:hypothetical protein
MIFLLFLRVDILVKEHQYYDICLIISLLISYI